MGKFELGARLETMTKAARQDTHQEVMAERSIALLHRCGCTGANRYLTNVITRRGCKCDRCRKKRADARAEGTRQKPKSP